MFPAYISTTAMSWPRKVLAQDGQASPDPDRDHLGRRLTPESVTAVGSGDTAPPPGTHSHTHCPGPPHCPRCPWGCLLLHKRSMLSGEEGYWRGFGTSGLALLPHLTQKATGAPRGIETAQDHTAQLVAEKDPTLPFPQPDLSPVPARVGLLPERPSTPHPPPPA